MESLFQLGTLLALTYVVGVAVVFIWYVFTYLAVKNRGGDLDFDTPSVWANCAYSWYWFFMPQAYLLYYVTFKAKGSKGDKDE